MKSPFWGNTRDMKKYAAICLSMFFFMLPPISFASGFRLPEKLVYDLTWAGIKTGTATLEISSENEKTRIVSTARSVDWVSVFYTVEDRIESELSTPPHAAVPGIPQNYRVRIREGRHRRNKEVVFDCPNRRASFTDHLSGEKKEIEIRESTFDPLSSFYHVRTLKPEVGKSLYVEVLDNKKLWNVEVQVLRKERISTSLGDFDTIVIKPLLKSEGIFNKRGDMYIWLTDDNKHVPVKLQTKVAVGKVTATLTGGNY
jgi:hypothetical protein